MPRELALRDVVQLQRGQSYKSARLDEPGPVLLGLGTINRNGGFRGENLKTYGGESLPRTLLQPGDLYVSLKDVTHAADLLGAVARVPDSIESGRLTQDTIRLDVDDELIDRDYLYWALRTPVFRAYCRARGTGTTNLDLSRGDFLAYRLGVPDRAEQRAIAEVLGALDDKIAANVRLTGIAEALAISLASQFEPSIALGELVTHQKKPVTPLLMEESTVAHFSLPAFDTGALPELTAPGDIKSSKFAIERPSVLVSKLNPRFPRVWNISDVPAEPALASTEFLVLEPSLSSTTVLWAALSQPAFGIALESKVAGTSGSHQRVRPVDLLATRVADPQLMSEGLKSSVDAIGANARQARMENRTLAATRDALLPQLMSGKLRVKDAEKQLEGVL